LIHYEESLKAEEADEDDNHLVALYNVAEARRRSTQSIVIAEWNKVVLTFEKALAGVSSLPLPMRANQLQAMHVAYACLGNVERAKSLLDETTKLASQASRQERLFSVAHYDNLPLSDFIAYNRQMREALDRDELWDGMKLKINDKPE
jgi:hypothetical protein